MANGANGSGMNGTGQMAAKLEAVTESVTMRLIARAAMVATPVLVAVFGFVLVDIWNEQKALNKDLADGLQSLDRRVLTIEVKREVEAQVKREIDGLSGGRSPSRHLPKSVLPE